MWTRLTTSSTGLLLGLATSGALAASLQIAQSPLPPGCSAPASRTAPIVAEDTQSQGIRLIQAGFEATDWSGYLRAYAVAADGSLSPAGSGWTAERFAPHPDARRIITWDGQRGRPFRWDELTPRQREALVVGASHPGSAAEAEGRRLLAWLRGDRTNAGAEPGQYRSRGSLLGDIVHSTPAYVSAPDAPYPDRWGEAAPENTRPYSSFRAAQTHRNAVVYVGANDGMLHAFDAGDATEIFAYVPDILFPHLPALADRAYSHRYYVDGSPVVMDAFFDDTDGAWHTVLVGSLRAGGQGLYAIDVTDPPAVTAGEQAFADRVLWEFTDADHADLGFTFGAPNIVRLASGDWAVMAGNGYDNTEPDGKTSRSGSAVLYVIDIETGGLLAAIDTREGVDEDPRAAGRPNGLSTIAPIDVDGDYVVDYAYAGDLFGNLWKFDLRSANPAEWRIAFDGYTSDPQPFFRARLDPADPTTAQPITTRPEVIRHPVAPGDLMVLFATGADFEEDSAVNAAGTNSVYGLRDRGSDHDPRLTRGHLLRQSVVSEILPATGVAYRVTTDHPLPWHDGQGLPVQPEACSGIAASETAAAECRRLGWHLDLPDGGEGVVNDPLVHNGRLLVPTRQSAPGGCTSDETWLMELDPETGGAPPRPPPDINGDGTTNDADMPDADEGVAGEVAVTGRRVEAGGGLLPLLLARLPATGAGGPPSEGDPPAAVPTHADCLEHRYLARPDASPAYGTVLCDRRAVGRQSWLELR